MVMTDPDNRRRWASLGLLLVIFILGLLTFRFAADAASTTDALKDSDDVAGCRAVFRADLDDAQANASVLFLRGLAAATSDNDAFLAEILTPDAEGLTVVDRTLTAVETAADEYAAAVEASIDHPDAFRAQCAGDR